MSVQWEIRRSGPDDAEHGVLLLPGGACAARSYDGVLAEPALAGVRLVAATMPGHAGTPPPDDFSIENYARMAAELAKEHRCDVVVGFSMGATVAVEMVTSHLFNGPVVLTGISLSHRDEPTFFKAIVRLGGVFGSLPVTALMKMTTLFVKKAKVSDTVRAAIREDLAKNDPKVVSRSLDAYLRYQHQHPSPAERLCAAGVPVWTLHAEKGDGGLTKEERATLDACPHATVVTIPGAVFFLPEEEPKRIAETTVAALSRVS